MDVLDNWPQERAKITDMDEMTLKGLLAKEKKDRCRETVAIALHQRISRLRTDRERTALKEYIANRRAREAAKAAKRK